MLADRIMLAPSVNRKALEKDLEEETPVTVALGVYLNSPKLITEAMQRGSAIHETDAQGYTPLLTAVKTRANRAALFLLENQADVNHANNWGTTSLMFAARRKGNHAMVVELIRRGANVHKKNHFGWDAQMFALLSRDPQIITYLNQHAQRGAPEDLSRNLSLISAVSQHVPRGGAFPAYPGIFNWERPATVEHLIGHGTNVNFQDWEGNTPLIYAANAGNQFATRLLLEAGADPNLRNREGESAIFFAVRNEYLDIVEALLSAGASKHLTNINGQSLWDVGRSRQNSAFYEALKKRLQ